MHTQSYLLTCKYQQFNSSAFIHNIILLFKNTTGDHTHMVTLSALACGPGGPTGKV